MTGTLLIDKVRNLLKDGGVNLLEQVGPTTNNIAGQFWTDYEILLSLNIAQDYVLNRSILSGDREILAMLHRTTGYIFNNGRRLINGTTLPNDYLTYINALVGMTAATQRLARIYEGGECLAYINAKHDAVFLHGNTVAFSVGGNYNGGGTLFYYCRPTNIVEGDFNNSFPNEIYYNVIARYAASILGTKEIHTQRDYKNWKYTQDAIQYSQKTNSTVPVQVSNNS